MRCLKLLGERLMFRDFDRQVVRASDQGVRGLSRTNGVHPLTPKPLHRPRNAAHAARRIGLSGKGTAAFGNLRNKAGLCDNAAGKQQPRTD